MMRLAEGADTRFAQWLREGLLPEVKPGVQERSVRTAQALVDAGLRLLEHRVFEAISLEDLCEEAGVTIGAFYGRFEDKKSYFRVLQRVTSLRSQVAFNEFNARIHAAKEPDLQTVCEALTLWIVGRYQTNAGIYRSALRQAADGSWEPFRQLGDMYRKELVALLVPLVTHVDESQRALRVQAAYQMLVGTLVHATLNDPGPLRFQDQAMTRELTRMVLAYLQAGS